jgi:hypothetical protein
MLCTIANHAREEQFAILLPILKDYSIIEKLSAIIGNNTSTNNILYYIIEAHFLKEEDIE